VRTALVVALLAVAVLLAACATSSQVEDLEARIAELEQAATSTTTATTRDISGTLSTPRPRVTCLGGTNGIFIVEGDRITIHDGSDATLAIDYLSDKTENETEKPADATCTFTFTFPDVPTDQGFYRIRIDDVYWSFNQADLEADDWELELNIRR
jgi:hypothetical protein